jgi:hypothetical protein
MRTFVLATVGAMVVACGGKLDASVPEADATAPGESNHPGEVVPPTDAAFEDAGGQGGGATEHADGAVVPPADAGACGDTCTLGLTCCDGKCVDTGNNPFNCGSCRTKCEDSTPVCFPDQGCGPQPACIGGVACEAGADCCGADCCITGQLCCLSEGPSGSIAFCFTPTAKQPTCPPGCRYCG